MDDYFFPVSTNPENLFFSSFSVMSNGHITQLGGKGKRSEARGQTLCLDSVGRGRIGNGDWNGFGEGGKRERMRESEGDSRRGSHIDDGFFCTDWPLRVSH